VQHVTTKKNNGGRQVIVADQERSDGRVGPAEKKKGKLDVEKKRL